MRGALIADTMPASQLTAAMGISRTTSDSARIAGALAGAGMVAVFGMAQAYVVVTAFYALGALLTWCARSSAFDPHPAAHPAQNPAVIPPITSPWRDLKEGVIHIWNSSSLLALMWLAFLYNLTAFSLTNGLLPYVAKDVYRSDQTGLGYLVASLALGALVGALATTRFGGGVSLPRVMIVSAVIWHLLLLAFAQMQDMPLGIVTLFLTGVAQSLTMVTHTVILLHASERRFRGRIMGVRMLAIYSLPLGLLVAGALIGRIGFAVTASAYAVVGIVCTVLIALYWREDVWRARSAADST
jgi:Na+/melibiose symporter-like transporter